MAQCLELSPEFRPPGDLAGAPLSVLAVIDLGSGPSLYVGGGVGATDGSGALYVLRWTGSGWAQVGPNAPWVDTLIAFDPGTGPGLYSGDFRWEGSSWIDLGSPVGLPYAQAVFDDGSGPALYVGGRFWGPDAPANIAKWDGASWSMLGSGVNDEVDALAVFDDGSGPALYAGGSFTSAGGIPTGRIARWDGASWSTLGVGVNGPVKALAVHDDGSGPSLFVAGSFTSAGGSPANHVARWDGTSWSPLGGGVGHVKALAVYDSGAGARLVAGCWLSGPHHVAEWDGASWSAVGGDVDDWVFELAVFDAGTGPELIAAGDFETAGGVAANRLARWNGTSWAPLVSSGLGVTNMVSAFLVHDDGSGSELFVGGAFRNAGGTYAAGVAKWDGSAWSALGSGVAHDAPPHSWSARVDDFAAHDDGSGPALYASGSFSKAGGNPANNVARWDGTAWTALGGGLTSTGNPFASIVVALASFDDGTGAQLYAGGEFQFADGAPASHIARWDGAAWSPLGSGTDQRVKDLAVFDDGSGPALYVAGDFQTAGGVSSPGVARWDGTSWSAVGPIVSGSTASALAVLDLGAGPDLYAASYGGEGSYVARWTGSGWRTLGDDFYFVEYPFYGEVRALSSVDDGFGPRLYVAGSFDGFAGEMSRWNGTAWEDSPVHAYFPLELALFDDGSGLGPDLYLGGGFSSATATGGEIRSDYIARWRMCPGEHRLFCSSSSASCPCSSFGDPGRGCANSSTPGALLRASGTRQPDTVVLHAEGELPSALTIFLQGNARTDPVAFGDGLRCVGGALKRLYVKGASGGAASAPGAGEPSIRARSAQLGDPIPDGAERYYMTYYRDPSPAFCPPPQGSTFNSSNALEIRW